MPESTCKWPLGRDTDGFWWVDYRTCPNCHRVVAWLGWSQSFGMDTLGNQRPFGEQQWILVRPKASGRPPVPAEVPEGFAEDYREACLVIADSPKASAALRRRCFVREAG